MKNIKLLLLVLLGSIAVSPLHAAGQKRQAPGSDERTAKRLRTEAPEQKEADGWDGFVDADDQVLPDALEDSSFNDADEKRVVANRVAPAQQPADDQAETGSLNPCTNCQYQNDATATECGVCAYKPGEVIEQQVVHNHPKDKVVKARNAKHQKLDEGTQAPTPSHAHTFTFEAFFPNGGGCEDLFWVHGYEFFHIDDVYNLVKTNKTIHRAFFKTVLAANYPFQNEALNMSYSTHSSLEQKFFMQRLLKKAQDMNNLPYAHLLIRKKSNIDAYITGPENSVKKFLIACKNCIFSQTLKDTKQAISQGAYVNSLSNLFGTDLSQATSFTTPEMQEIVRHLLTIPGINVNSHGSVHRPPLFNAIFYKNTEQVKLLLAIPEIDIDSKYLSEQITALEYAQQMSKIDQKQGLEILYLIEDLKALRNDRKIFTALEDSAPTLPHQLFEINGIILIVGEFLGAREPRVEVIQDQENGE